MSLGSSYPDLSTYYMSLKRGKSEPGEGKETGLNSVSGSAAIKSPAVAHFQFQIEPSASLTQPPNVNIHTDIISNAAKSNSSNNNLLSPLKPPAKIQERKSSLVLLSPKTIENSYKFQDNNSNNYNDVRSNLYSAVMPHTPVEHGEHNQSKTHRNHIQEDYIHQFSTSPSSSSGTHFNPSSNMNYKHRTSNNSNINNHNIADNMDQDLASIEMDEILMDNDTLKRMKKVHTIVMPSADEPYFISTTKSYLRKIIDLCNKYKRPLLGKKCGKKSPSAFNLNAFFLLY
jgi:hypothetical protein